MIDAIQAKTGVSLVTVSRAALLALVTLIRWSVSLLRRSRHSFNTLTAEHARHYQGRLDLFW